MKLDKKYITTIVLVAAVLGIVALQQIAFRYYNSPSNIYATGSKIIESYCKGKSFDIRANTLSGRQILDGFKDAIHPEYSEIGYVKEIELKPELYYTIIGPDFRYLCGAEQFDGYLASGCTYFVLVETSTLEHGVWDFRGVLEYLRDNGPDIGCRQGDTGNLTVNSI